MQNHENKQVELTILMPCLNEARTVGECVSDALSFLRGNNIIGEVLISDNGSTDGSQEIARQLGARVIDATERGYGAALIAGCEAALGKYVIMGDTDGSHNLKELMPFLTRLREGFDLIVGNRFKGGIEKGAMSPLHRYLGNPILSAIGRILFPSPITDFHCGLRGYNTESIRKLDLHTTGMEYASEMIVQATLNKLRITEIPTTMRPDGRDRPPHLRSWHDGWRHLKFLLMHSPNWLFLVPGMVFFFIGVIGTVAISISDVILPFVGFGVNTMVYAVLATIIGSSILSFWIIAKVYAQQSGYIPPQKNLFILLFTAERGTLIGIILVVIGIVLTVAAFLVWDDYSTGDIAIDRALRLTLPSLALVSIGIQMILTSFLADIIRIRKNRKEWT